MYEVQCFDSYGNSIGCFSQWDIDQKVFIPISGYEDCLSGEINQHVHFCNVKSETAYVVRATIINDAMISAEVPNILLKNPYSIHVYVYLTDSEDVSSQRTILHTEIPIRKRVKPDNYNYVENIERITAEMIKEEIEAETKQTVTDAINKINEEKTFAVGKINEEEALAIGEINKEEGFAVNNINKEEALAVEEINKEEAAALKSIADKQDSAETTLQEYIDEGYQIKSDTDKIKSDTQVIKEETDKIKSETNQIKSDTDKIKSDTQSIKEDAEIIKEDTQSIKEETQIIADTTADTITADIYNRIEVVGLQLYTTDDGNGNVISKITIPKTI